MRIITSELLQDQWRVPRSKKERIRKKWRKRPANWRPSRTVIVDMRLGIIYCHPIAARQLFPPRIHSQVPMTVYDEVGYWAPESFAQALGRRMRSYTL